MTELIKCKKYGKKITPRWKTPTVSSSIRTLMHINFPRLGSIPGGGGAPTPFGIAVPIPPIPPILGLKLNNLINKRRTDFKKN